MAGETQTTRDRILIAVAVLAVTALCWLWIVPMARDMYGPMTGPSAWMMTGAWDLRYVLLIWAMWGVMMAGMMLPSASPMLILYNTVARRGPGAALALTRVSAMAAGYLLVWLLFSAGATLLQAAASRLLLITPMMETASPWAGGVLLLAAGIYQFTPLKATCLRACRSPLSFIMQRWRAGIAGAFRMGLAHGRYCLGCCWALMLLLFVGGVMNLWVIAALTSFVLIEKLAPFGVHSARLAGVALIALGLWMFVG
jgi:predicted metal-binding membrane protein